MNLKTTIVLVLLVGAGAGGWFWLDTRKKPSETTSSATLDFLKDKLTAAKLTRIEVQRRPKTLDEPRRRRQHLRPDGDAVRKWGPLLGVHSFPAQADAGAGAGKEGQRMDAPRKLARPAAGNEGLCCRPHLAPFALRAD